MSVIDNDREFDRNLETTNLDEYEVIDLPREQLNDLSHEHMGIRMATTLDVGIMSLLAPCEGSLTV